MRTARRPFLCRVPLAVMAAATLAGALLPAAQARHESSPDRATRQAILDCTFEVLSHLRGESTQAQPRVRVAGTAFCFADGELATAAHVFDQVLGGRFDTPFVRDRKGRTYPVEKILRYSMRDDFVVFTVTGLPSLPARAHAELESASITSGRKDLYLSWRRADDDLAFSKARYLGRSSLERLGREGWIEFGPAPAHGASGAPVYDGAGNVVGLINGRSSERADAHAYAVPIRLIDEASTSEAVVATADPLRILGMPSQRNLPLVGGIPLPATFARFNQHMVDVRKTYFAYTLPYSLSLSGTGAPMSDAERIELCASLGAGYCADGPDAATSASRADKRARGCDVKWKGVGAALVECRSRNTNDGVSAAEDIQLQLTMASTGRRHLQPTAALCAPEDPLEPLAATDSFTDHTGAIWQTRAWPVKDCDWMVISMSRPTPGGTIALVRGAPSAYADAASMQLKALTAIRCESCEKVTPAESVLADIRQLGDSSPR